MPPGITGRWGSLNCPTLLSMFICKNHCLLGRCQDVAKWVFPLGKVKGGEWGGGVVHLLRLDPSLQRGEQVPLGYQLGQTRLMPSTEQAILHAAPSSCLSQCHQSPTKVSG